MFSFVGDTVLDPFCGTGTTMLAALRAGRNSIGIELGPAYCRMAQRRLDRESRSLFGQPELTFEPAARDYTLPPQPAPTVAEAEAEAQTRMIAVLWPEQGCVPATSQCRQTDD